MVSDSYHCYASIRLIGSLLDRVVNNLRAVIDRQTIEIISLARHFNLTSSVRPPEDILFCRVNIARYYLLRTLVKCHAHCEGRRDCLLHLFILVCQW